MTSIQPTRSWSVAARPRGSAAIARGLTLVELLIVLALMSIMVGVAIPAFEPHVADALEGAANSVVADLDFVREFAIANNTTYRVTFEPNAERYFVEHQGSSSVWDQLPVSVHFESESGSGNRNRWVTNLQEMLAGGLAIELVSVTTVASGEPLTTLDFEASGEIEPAERVVIWLACGSGPQRRYVPVYIEPTGLAWAGDVTTASGA